MDIKLIIRYVIRETMGLVVMALALFWTAGTMKWWQAWAALAVMLLWIAGTAFFILKYNPELLAERLGPRKGAKTWDTAIMSALGLSQLARYIVAGFDERYGWSGEFSLPVQIASLVISLIGYALVLWAMAHNAYFSQIVRIQKDRGQSVVTSGPYRFIRHPAYIGAIMYEIAVAFLLDSWWTLIPGAVGVLLLITRTALEDKSLQKELNGYNDYTRKTRYRLIPGIW